MTIQPDTSLYDNLPDKLRAMAEAISFPSPGILELLPPNSKWEVACGRSKELCGLLSAGYEFRIRPKPREIFHASWGGNLGAPFDSKKEAEQENPDADEIIRFVQAVDE